MGSTVPLRILLICLLHFCAVVDGDVDPKTLMNIVKNLENQLGDQGQYAVAFSVEKEKCLKNSGYAGQDLITKEVKDAFKKNEVYVGENLIAAKPKQEEKYTDHAEFRIQNYLKKILEKEDQCVVYFTVNSPCMDKCIKKGGFYTIDNSLKWLQDYKNGAFAFKIIWKYDKKEAVISRLKEIAPNLPYYQCEKNKANCDRL